MLLLYLDVSRLLLLLVLKPGHVLEDHLLVLRVVRRRLFDLALRLLTDVLLVER